MIALNAEQIDNIYCRVFSGSDSPTSDCAFYRIVESTIDELNAGNREPEPSRPGVATPDGFVLNYHGQSLTIQNRDLPWIILILTEARKAHAVRIGFISPDDEPEPLPVGMDYISEDGYLHTWDGTAWRNDGPVSNETRICLRMIRALNDRISLLEGKLR